MCSANAAKLARVFPLHRVGHCLFDNFDPCGCRLGLLPLANLLRGKKDHKIQTTQIVPQTSEMKENESPVGLASCRNGAPTAVNPDLELVGGETIREGNFMTANHTSHLVRPSKTSTAAADENQEAEVTDGWCDPTQNK